MYASPFTEMTLSQRNDRHPWLMVSNTAQTSSLISRTFFWLSGSSVRAGGSVAGLSVHVSTRTSPLRLKFGNNTLHLEAGAGDEAQATEEIQIAYTGEAIDIAFNPTFLTDGLNALGTTYVNIAFTGSNKPAVLSGKNKIDGEIDSTYRYLLMPMRYAS